jgi:16S rRNA (uracil1498-N3)-methyltransferase
VSAPLFYVDVIPAPGATAVVDGDEGFHAATVRRIRPGESLVLSDGAGTVADCVVISVEKRSLTARVEQRGDAPPPRPPVTVVQAIPKSERSELAIELATEAGADDFIAWQAQRCVARWDGERGEKGLRRWRAVARSAARQSRRAWIPDVSGPLSTDALCRYLAEQIKVGAVVLMLHAGAPRLLAAGVSLPGLHEQGTDPDRIAFEGYPGLLARSVLGRESYKSDDPARRLDAPRRAARERLVCALEAGAHHFETRIDFAQWRADCIEDAGADLLDAVSCAAQAAWAWRRRDQRWGLPKPVDPVEGWIIGS